MLRTLSCPSSITVGQSVHIQSEWSNLGVAPIYTNWNVTYSLLDKSSGKVVWTATSKLNLKSLLPTFDEASKIDQPLLVDDQFEIPASLAKGKYNLELSVLDPTNYYNPLKLAIQGRNSNGAYLLGEIKVSSK